VELNFSGHRLVYLGRAQLGTKITEIMREGDKPDIPDTIEKKPMLK
jgi:hypothetical protein